MCPIPLLHTGLAVSFTAFWLICEISPPSNLGLGTGYHYEGPTSISPEHDGKPLSYGSVGEKGPTIGVHEA